MKDVLPPAHLRPLSVVGVLPSTELSNAEMGQQLGVAADWIKRRSGIEYRRRLAPDDSVAQLAASAARGALSLACREAADLIVVASVSNEMRSPSIASQVSWMVGLNAPALDVSAACAGFIYATNIVRSMAASSEIRSALIVGVDSLGTLSSESGESVAPLFGDGAGAMYLELGPGTSFVGRGVWGGSPKEPEANKLAHAGGLTLDGIGTFVSAVREMASAILGAVSNAGWRLDDVDRFVLHQANARILAAVGRELGIGSSRFADHISSSGNTSAASIPIALARDVTEGLLRPGDRVVLAAFGASDVWGACAVVWPNVEAKFDRRDSE